MKSLVRLGAGIAVLGALAACGSMGSTSADSFGPEGASSPDAGSGSVDAPTTRPGVSALDNGIILVHASNTSAFRLCFENEPNLLPQPDSEVMPDSNIVAVEIGTAVRIDPLHGSPGEVTLYNEDSLRGMYGPGKANDTCGQLKLNTAIAKYGTSLGPVSDDLSQGVHLLAVTGCVAKSGNTTTCGSSYVDDTGNLGVLHESLTGYGRQGQDVLPMQVVHLAQPLADRQLDVVFRDGDHPANAEVPIARALQPFSAPAPSMPAQLPFDASDAGIFASYWVEVQVAGDAGADAGTLFAQSLADIQNLSSPRDLPTTYYAKASNFVLLLLGDPAAVQVDGGGDPYRVPHLLAIPVIEPKADAGADGGDGG